MRRLGLYLIGLFTSEAMALYGLVLALLFMIRVLAVADVASVRTEGVALLLFEAVLSMVPLATAFLYVCLSIGLARGLRGLAQSRELHILHVSRKMPALFGAIATYTLLGTAAVLVLAHFVSPAAGDREHQIRSQVAAQLVGTQLVPGRFAQLAPGVTVTVGGRRGDGQITAFFADDTRTPGSRRTYMADTAEIATDAQGYVLRLNKGSIQYRNSNGSFSQVAFAQYDLALDRLTGGASTSSDDDDDQSTLGYLAQLLATGTLPPDAVRRLADRTAEGLRVIALCLLVTAIAGFPTGRRRPPWLPIEIVVLAIAFAERTVSTYLHTAGPLSSLSGSMLLIGAALVILVLRLRLLRPIPLRASA